MLMSSPDPDPDPAPLFRGVTSSTVYISREIRKGDLHKIHKKKTLYSLL